MSVDAINYTQDNLIIEKSVNMTNAVVMDTIEYSIKIYNGGNYLIKGITIIDNLESSLKFVPGSVSIDFSCSNANILKGINLGCLRPNETKIVSFKATIIKMPESGYIYNFAVAKYFYQVPGESCLNIYDKRSNIVATKVDIAELEVTKLSNMDKASLGEKVTYSITIKNIGTLDAIGILLIDPLPKEVTLVPESLKINGETINYLDNDLRIYVGDLSPKKCIYITYDVIITSSNCKRIICNEAYAIFNYNLCNFSFGEKKSECTSSSISHINLEMSTFKQLSIDTELSIPSYKPGISEINSVTTDIIIDEYYEISTPKLTSSEGQILTGYKLVIRGFLQEILEYISDDYDEQICIEIYKIPFSTFLILPEDYELGSNISLDGIVENVYFKELACKNVFANITLLISAKLLCC